MIGDAGETVHTITASLVDDPPKELRPISGTITLDENWSPYGQITLKFPALDLVDLYAIDPAVDTFIDVRLSTIDIDTDEAVDRDFDGMMLRSRSIDHAAATATITLATLDARLHDHAHVSDTVPELFPPSTVNTIRKAVDWVLSYIGVTISSGNVDTGAAGAAFDYTKNPWRTGDTAWSYIAPIVQKADLRLWCDQAGVWHLRTVQPTPVLSAAFDADNTLIQITDTIDLDSTVVDSVLVTYQWVDGAGAQQTEYDAARNGSSSRLPFTVTYNRPYPGDGAAARILAAKTKRRRAVNITAISDYRVTPGMPMTIHSPYVPDLEAVVSAVRWMYPDDEMQIRTRDVEEA